MTASFSRTPAYKCTDYMMMVECGTHALVSVIRDTLVLSVQHGYVPQTADMHVVIVSQTVVRIALIVANNSFIYS